ncbi:MAG: hypothetical protein M3159_02315 [Actinomycetota bacterium]|nr:hypothetical protein [Actinomycetota bacterium]
MRGLRYPVENLLELLTSGMRRVVPLGAA